MAITTYTKPSIITAYFTALAQATNIVMCSTSANPTWTVAQVNTDKICEAAMTIAVGAIGGDYSETTSGGFPCLRVAAKTVFNASVAGTGRCIVLHDGANVLRAFPISDFPVVLGSILQLPSFDILYK